MKHTNFVTQTSHKQRKTALILCLLGFVGLGGLHYFYVGRYGRGILYFLTAGFFLIGTVIDLLKILPGSFEDATGLPLRG